jgi:hypothetical protein
MTRLTEAEQQMRDNLADILVEAGWYRDTIDGNHRLGEAIPAIMRELEIKPQGDALDAMKLAITALVAVTNNAPESIAAMDAMDAPKS